LKPVVIVFQFKVSLLKDLDILIHDCTIVTMDTKQTIIDQGFIAVKNGKIVNVGKRASSALSLKAKKKIRGTGKVALPGLVNCHTHVPMTLFRGMAEDKPLEEWLKETIWPLEAKLRPKDIYDGALLGCLEMIKSGTTCFADMYFHEEIVAKAVEKAGLRAVLAEGIIEASDSARGTKMLNDAIEVAEKFDGYANGRVRVRLGPHAVYSCSSSLLRKVRESALKLNVGVHIHLAESMEKAKSLGEVALLENINFFTGVNVLAAHCIHLSKEDMRTLVKHGVTAAYNPVANMKLAMGVPKISDMLKLGIIIGIGTDGPASNNTLDMFESMKAAALLQKVFSLNPTVLPAETVLKMATIQGARALGLQQSIGSLEVGKRADIILLDFDKPHLTPKRNLCANIVYSAHGSDVDTVIVDGRVLMEKQKVNTMNESEVMQQAKRTALDLVT